MPWRPSPPRRRIPKLRFTRIAVFFSSEESSMTGQNFVQVISGNPLLNGSIVSTPPYVLGMGQPSALNCVNATPQNPQITAQNAVPLDRIVFDLALTAIPPGVGTTFATFGKYVGGFAKNGACLINLTGTTAVSIDLTALGTFTGLTSQSGDTSLATVNCLIFNNLGTLAVTIAPGATNP